MNRVFDDDGKSEILREPFQGRPFLLGPVDGGAQSKFQLASAVAGEGVVALCDRLALLAGLLEKIGFLADSFHGASGVLKQAQLGLLP